MAPSPWAVLGLAIWWAWRYAALPPSAVGSAWSLVGFGVDAVFLYGMFGGLRAQDRRRPALATWSRRIVLVGMVVGALMRAVDALQVHLTGTHITSELLVLLAENPAQQAVSLRGLLLAVVVSVAIGGWALAGDRDLARRTRTRLATPDDRRWQTYAERLAVVSLLLSLVGFLTATDPAAIAPEAAFINAALQWLNG